MNEPDTPQSDKRRPINPEALGLLREDGKPPQPNLPPPTKIVYIGKPPKLNRSRNGRVV